MTTNQKVVGSNPAGLTNGKGSPCGSFFRWFEPRGFETTTCKGVGKRRKRQPSGLFAARRKRPEFVSAKRAQAPPQGACATIERTESNPAGLTKREALKSASFLYVSMLSAIWKQLAKRPDYTCSGLLNTQKYGVIQLVSSQNGSQNRGLERL